MTTKQHNKYLESWANDSGEIAVLREGYELSYKPIGELLESFLKMVQDMEEEARKVLKDIESFVGTIEKNVSPILDSLQTNPKVGYVDNPQHLIVFLAVYRFRASFLRAKTSKEAGRLFLTAFNFMTRITKNLNGYRGDVIELGDDSEFITSDNPVIEYSPWKADCPLSPELFFPITPKKGLLLHKFPLVIDPLHITCFVEAINDRMFEKSDSWIYATNTDILKRYAGPLGVK